MTDDDHVDFRRSLQRFATSVGDPPEHGLERLAARRHRRLRRRRGAVVTAAALAVLVGLIATIGSNDEPADVAASAAEQSGPRPASELPATAELRCGPGGILVPVASVRPQSEGLHLRVLNTHRGATTVWVEGDDWASGPIRVDPGITEQHHPVPPGILTIGCEVQGEPQQRRVDLIDVDGVYQVPQLSCRKSEQVMITDLPVDPETGSLITATRRALAPALHDDDSIGAPRGYVRQRLAAPTTDPLTQLTRDGRTVAFVRLRGADEGDGGAGGGGDGDADAAVRPPWVAATEVIACPEVAAELGTDGASADAAEDGDGAGADGPATPGGDGGGEDSGTGDGTAADDGAAAAEGDTDAGGGGA
ncbi:MAG: hypothetical protein ACLFXM_10325 [Acidimicrobiia bacterium]